MLAAGYGVMFTVLDDFRYEYGIEPKRLGVIVAVGFFSSFLAQVLIAPLADRGYARRLVFLGVLLNAVGMVGMAFGTRAAPLMLARFVMGLGAGTAIPAVKRIVILAEPDNVGRNLGLVQSSDIFGFAFGPAISAVLVGPFGLSAPFLVLVVVSLLCLPIISRTHVAEAAEAPSQRLAVDLFSNRRFAAAVALGSAAFLMIGTFDALWVLVLDDLGAADWIANLGIVMFAVPLVVLGPLSGKLAERVGPLRLAPAGLILGAFYMMMYGQMPTGAAMLAVGLVHAFTDGFTFAATSVAVSQSVEPERQASAQGMLGAVQVIVGGLTAIGAGFAYGHRGRTTAYTACAVLMVSLVTWAVWHAAGDRRQEAVRTL
jgi:MFS family permease